MEGFCQTLGEFQEDFGRIWEDPAGLRQEVGWIGQSRAHFGRKIADSRGDLVAWPGACLGANLVLEGWRTAEGARPIPNFLSEVILDISDFSMLLTRLRPSKGSAVF